MAEKILQGGEYLIKETPCEDVFTPEDFSDEHRQMGETTEQFVANEIAPHIEEIEKQNFDIVVEGMRKCGELGLLMMDAPEDFGGLELDKASSMLVVEKMSYGGSFSVAYSAHSGIGTLPLIYY
jgi:alkylation response protein AidB-like acyl-CoA dehydrogenase